MAFNKRTWKGRQGTGLNKFSIDGATPVTVVNQPDSITEQGDALSAGNLNDLEQRIYDAFDDIADGTQIVGKATADALGNVIDQTYATKADLQDGTLVVKEAEIASKDEDGNNIKATYETKAEASDLKSAIQGNSQRIENLEVAVSGSLVQTNVLTDPPSMANVRTITNANEILPWAILKRVGARAVAWNQQIKNGNFNGTTNWDNITGTSYETISASNNEMTVSVVSTSVANGISQAIDILAGHTYLVCAEFYPSSATTVKISSQGWLTQTLTANSWNRITYVKPVTTALSRLHFYIDNGGVLGAGSSVKIRNVMLFDLTAMNEASLTADQFRTLFPTSYYPYNTGSIIPLNPSAFKVVGKNKIDISTMVRTDKDGTPINGWLRWTTLVRYESGQTYYMKCNGLNITIFAFQIFFYDADGNYIIGDSSNRFINPTNGFSFTLPTVDGAFYFSVGFYHSSSLASYTPTEVLLCLNSVNDKTYEAYKETTLDTSFTSDYKYVNENCHDYSENVLVNGVMRREEHKGIVGSYTFTGNETVYGGTNGNFNTPALGSLAKFPSSSSVKANIVFEGYVTRTAAKVNDMDSPMSVGAYQDTVTFYNPSVTSTAEAKAELAGKTIYFESATPTTSLHNDPIPNFPTEDGTTITAITPQTDLVNAIDVPNTIAYMTKISS